MRVVFSFISKNPLRLIQLYWLAAEAHTEASHFCQTLPRLTMTTHNNALDYYM
ncbi:hypothetical protein EDWATA_02013 [Edwardsiella tarda ATCC 23685]|uniref:Uncharacterized protein n=1 Tax=Edwardsiella tarda ATCC 23685 TaxID=500638 RepID=D4F5I6_EDWTA|nr:hypothetical protein EDWATA_02013 [Edwardsiella tarda ATCC 23685]